MTLWHEMSERLARPDWIQLATLLLVALVFTWFVTWPTHPQDAHDGWYLLAQVRSAGLALLALGYGSFLARSPRREKLGSLLAVLSLNVLTMPFEVISYALSYPGQPLPYLLGVSLLDSVALFGLGLTLGALLATLHLEALLPLLAPAALAGLVFVDLRLGLTLLNPLTALSAVAPLHLGLMTVIALSTLVYLLRSQAHPEVAS